MPLDPKSGVYFEVHRTRNGAAPALMIGLPLMASHAQIFGADSGELLRGYLDRLIDAYQVMLIDYPSIGRSQDIAPQDLTAERVTHDLLAVASAAGFERFAYWGYSWSGAVGLQLASRTDRLSALVIGGWPAMGGPYEEILRAATIKMANPEPSSLAVLRSPAQYAQWLHFYRSVLRWPERQSLRAIQCPCLQQFGAAGDLVEAEIPVPIASRIRANRAELESLGWTVNEVAGFGHEVTLRPEVCVPPVRAFLDRVLQAAEVA
jgi:pimeloyl-ACP methyl ester carboxylesterase